ADLAGASATACASAADHSIVDFFVSVASRTPTSTLFPYTTLFRSTADTSSADSITQLYAGYFNRAPDPAGAAYWAGQLQGGTSSAQDDTAYSNPAEEPTRRAFLANPNVSYAAAVKDFVDANSSNVF